MRSRLRWGEKWKISFEGEDKVESTLRGPTIARKTKKMMRRRSRGIGERIGSENISDKPIECWKGEGMKESNG